MKKKLVIALSLLANIGLYAQTGINTPRPLTVFHVDGKGDNNLTGPLTPAQIANDVVVTAEGNLGIGTINPTNKLVIDNGTGANTGLQLLNGAESGKGLYSDNQGNAEWRPIKASLIFGNRNTQTHPNGINIRYNEIYLKYTGWSITLPPGKWLTTISMSLMFDTSGWFGEKDYIIYETTFSDDTTNAGNPSNDLLVPSGDSTNTTGYAAGIIQGYKPKDHYKFDRVMGNIIIHNKSNIDKTYYYMSMARHYNIENPADQTKIQEVKNYGANNSRDLIYALKID